MNQELVEQVYRVIKQEIDEKGRPPSHQEIADACFISKGSVGTYLNHLERQGKIYREPNVARGIRLLEGKSEQTSEHMVTL